jgi:CO/xanthine dehydrogenase Mo-binding subunit
MTAKIHLKLEDLPSSEPRWVGKDVKRIEDPKLVTGLAEFIENLKMPGMLHCAILRSPHPHALIKSVNASEALKHPDVMAVLTGEDVLKWTNPAMTVPDGWGTYCLATDKVRFVGEPVAAVAAISRSVAEDALELIEVEYETLPAVSDAEKAIEEGAPLIFEEKKTNIIHKRLFTWGEVDQTFADADHVITERFRWNRLGANPTETFGVVSQWDLLENSVTCRGSFQSSSHFALGRAATFGLPSNRVRIISHPHGGSFGGKGGARGTDIAALLSRKAEGRPVKWIEDRMEYLIAGGGQSWDRFYEASLALNADGMLTGLKVKLLDDIGATGESFGAISAAKPLAVFTGNYTIGAAQYDMTLVASNRLPQSPYRGMGPPPHYFVLESLVDMAARKLNMDVAEIRRKNYIQPEQFPYTIPSGNEYDSGNYEACLDKVLDLADYQALREEQTKAREAGRLVGISVVNAIEPGVFDWNAYSAVGMPGVGVPEGVTLSVDVMGSMTVRVGFSLEGQGQYTLAAQLVADYFGLEMDQVRVVHADTAFAPPHFGPGGSRLGVALTGAILGAAKKLETKFLAVAAGLMQTEPANMEMVDGWLRIKGVPDAEMPMAAVAGTMLARSDLLPPGMEPCPEATAVWTAPGRNEPDEEGRCKSYLTAANACHVVMLEVDRETGMVEILKYFVVDDCGTRLNPGNVDGMLYGAIAQGVGAALLEEYIYDENAQPLVSTFMDYLIPTINEVPDTKAAAMVTPSPFAPLGAKGCGENAIHCTPSAILCAINDALAPIGVMAKEVPASPNRLWDLIQSADYPLDK